MNGDKKVNLLMPAQQYLQLEGMVQETGRSKAEILRQAFDQFYREFCMNPGTINERKQCRDKWRTKINEKMIPDPAGYDKCKVAKIYEGVKVGITVVSAQGFNEPVNGERIKDDDDFYLTVYEIRPGGREYNIRWENITSIGFIYYKGENNV